MKLINHTLLYLSGILFFTTGIWAVLIYFLFFNQLKTTVDDGLSDHKIMIIDKLEKDPQIPIEDEFLDKNYTLRPVGEEYALKVRDTYRDTLVWSALKGKDYPVRLLTTAFRTENGLYYELKVISHEMDRGELIRRIVSSLLLLLLLLSLSTLVINNIVLKKTWKPFYRLLAYLDDFRLDTGTIPDLSETRIREFNLLNNSVMKLLSLNTDIYNSQKHFIENASHELQTPLAISISKLELLAGEEGLSPGQIRNIGEIMETLHRLSGLNRSLLLLSKIENKQFAAVEKVNFTDLFTSALSDFKDYSGHREISVKLQKTGTWIHEMNRDLAGIMVTNLVKNALIHNQQGGKLTVKIGDSFIEMENTGRGPAIPPEKLYRRFSKGAESKSSTGLGLAIIKAIVDISGLEISYDFRDKHRFTINVSR